MSACTSDLMTNHHHHDFIGHPIASISDVLHTWLFAHVPLSFAFLVLTAVHAVLSLRY